MASTGKNNGTLGCLYLNGSKITHLTTNSFSISHATRDATTKDSAGWEEVLEGLRSGNFSADMLFAEDATIGFDEFYAIVVTARTVATVRYSSAVSGDKYIEASCYLTSLSRSAGKEETETMSASFKVTGAITVGTV